MTTRIESKQNATLRHLARLVRDKKYRQGMDEMVCEGEKMLYEALHADIPVKVVLADEDAVLSDRARALIERAGEQGARLFTAAHHLFAPLSDVETPQGILFSCVSPRRMADDLPAALNGAVLLDGVQDPGNLGTILRTADALGLDAVILCEGCADWLAPKVVRATMGAVFRQPVYRMPLAEAIAALHTRDLSVYAAALAPESIPLGAVPLEGAAVIVGSEGRGVTAQALALCDQKIIIPMAKHAESLNAGVAASILIWEMTKGSGI